MMSRLHSSAASASGAVNSRLGLPAVRSSISFLMAACGSVNALVCGSLTGTTASADVDFAKPALKATFAVPAMLGLAGGLIAVDGKSYIKTTITGPLYQAAAPGDYDGNGTTEQFIALAQQISGQDLTALFQKWLFQLQPENEEVAWVLLSTRVDEPVSIPMR